MTSGCWRGPAGVALRSTAQGPHSRPVFLHLHGGAFSAGTPIGRDPVLRLIADRSEAVVFDLDYSMIPERTFPQAVHEAVAPLAHIRCNADVWGLDDSRLGAFKPLADFDWLWPKKIDRPLIERALTLDFIPQARNLILLGANGLAYVLHQDIHYCISTAARVLRALCENVRGALNVVQPRVEILTAENLH